MSRKVQGHEGHGHRGGAMSGVRIHIDGSGGGVQVTTIKEWRSGLQTGS